MSWKQCYQLPSVLALETLQRLKTLIKSVVGKQASNQSIATFSDLQMPSPTLGALQKYKPTPKLSRLVWQCLRTVEIENQISEGFQG